MSRGVLIVHRSDNEMKPEKRFLLIEVVSQPWITPEGKAQADSKAQQPRQYVSISRGLQRRHRASDGVMKPLILKASLPRESLRTRREHPAADLHAELP